MDLFPCAVTKPDGSVLPMIRLAVRDGVVSLWSAPGARVVESTSPLVQVQRGIRWTFEGVDGTWSVRYQPGECGCSSPLKSWSPRPHRVEVTR